MADWGVGYVPLDAALLASLWGAAAVNLHLGVVRKYQRRGSDRMYRRFAAVAFLGLAWLYTYRFVQFGYDLPSSPQNDLLMLLLSIGSTGLGLGRIRQDDRHRRKGDEQ